MLPFTGGIDNTANGAFLISVIAAMLYLLVLDSEESLRRSVIKTIPVAFLAVLSFVQGAPLLLVLALLLSAAGDAFLSREGDTAFLLGLGSFLAAHIAFIALFVSHDNELISTVTGNVWLLVLAVAMIVSTAVTLNVLVRGAPSALRLPVLAYGATIVLMGLAALTTAHPWIIAGAILFMVSDTILGIERFGMRETSPMRGTARYSVWILYYTAQLIITLGVIFAG